MVKITQMKKTTLRQVAFKLALVAFALLAPFGLRAQETLTVNDDGTANNSYIPFYGLYADTYGAASECVIPADVLSDMAGGEITAMKFYIQSSASAAWTGTHQVYLGEISATTLTGITGPSAFTVVKTASFDATGTELLIEFDQPYTYEGGNLLIGTFVSSAGNWKSAKFYGVGQTTNTGWYRNSNTAGGSAQQFLPKVTFTYELPSTDCDAPTSISVTAGSITPNGATVTWEGDGDTWNLRYKASTDADFTMINNISSQTYTFSTLTAGTQYNVGVQTDCGGSTSSFRSTTISTPVFFSNFNVQIVPGTGNESIFSWIETDVNFTPDEWQLCIDGDEENLITMDENPFTYDGLTPEQLTTAKMRAFVDDGNGNNIGGDWSNTVSFTPTDSYIITLNEGTNTNYYIPFYYSVSSNTPRSQFIIPSNDLTSIQWAEINGLTFYYNSATCNYGSANFSVYLAEVASTTMTSFTDWASMTEVYTGTLSVSDNEMIITFDNPFTYTTGNLLIGIKTNSTGTNGTSSTWKGVNTTTSGCSRYHSGSSWGSETSSSFLPKVTIEFTPGSAPSCLPPADLQQVANTTATTNSVDLEWTGHNESAWDLYYTTSASDIPDENTTPSREDIGENPYTLDGLTHSTHYYVYVRANCGGEQSLWSQRYEFFTACDAVTTFPWSENFDSRASGNFSDFCWVNEHISGTGTNIFTVTTSTNGNNSTHQLQLPDQAVGTLTELRLPQMNIPGTDYQFTFDIYRTNNTYSSNDHLAEGIRVYVSTNGEIEGATELAFVPRHIDGSNSLIPSVESVGWYTYEIPIGVSGNCYIILRGENQYVTSTYMDNFFVEQIPTCRKPSGLMLESPSARTAHTATLKWNNGEDGQNAWQIAYSTDANFNPAADFNPNGTTEWIVDANANPFTIENLDTNTTYYAYVRANCGDQNGLSAWSNAKATFKTLVGNMAPTGLTVSNLASTTATLSWTRATTNDLHESYDLYYSDVNEAPTATTIPTVSGFTNDSYEFTGLEPTTEYFVWVRDNCGEDGYSTWTGTSFTTLDACPTPTSLAASDIINNAATITWIGSSDVNNYTLQYREAAYIDGLEEEFGTNIPSGWSMYTGLLNGDGTATLASATYGWSFGSNNGVFDNHARVNIYSNYQRWLVTPTIVLPDNAALNFDIALTAYSGSNVPAPQTTGTDDKFIVLISTDDMATWTILRQWNNEDGAEYVYNNISNTATGENVNIDLSGYAGESVKIAFYGESTANNADNNLHIDNVEIGIPVPAGQWQTATSTVAEQNYTLNALEAKTKYDVQVKSNCSGGVYCQYISFTTKAIFEKVIEANKWYAIASPVHNDGNNQTLEGVTNLATGTYDLYGYTESAGTWNKPTTTLTRGKGYIYRRDNDATLGFIGDYNTGNFSASSISMNNPDAELKGFALVGNPYNHPIYKGVAFGDNSSYTTGWYSLRPNGSWYVQSDNDPIAVGEAALIKVSSSYSVSLSFTDNANAPSSAKAAHSTAISFKVRNAEFEDVAYAMFTDGDGLPKISHIAPNAPALSIPVEGQSYAIANLGYNCESFDMNFRGTEGQYTLTFNSQLSTLNYCHLIDRANGKDIDLLSQPTYTFTQTAGSVAERFLVKLVPGTDDNAGFVHWNGSAWVVEGNGTLQVFDVLGRRILTKDVNAQLSISTSQFPSTGVYILRLGEKSQKIVVK